MPSAEQLGSQLPAGYYPALFICVTILLAMMMGLLFYVLCSRRYRLNWFEKTRLDEAAFAEEGLTAQHRMSPGVSSVATGSLTDVTQKSSSPVGSSRCLRSQSTGKLDAADKSTAGSTGSLTSVVPGEFWVPPALQRQSSLCQSDFTVTEGSGDDCSLPGTPNSIKTTSFTVTPQGGPEKNISSLVKYVQPGLSSPGARPRVVSMYGKLDHTKFNTAMYQREESVCASSLEDMRGSVQFTISYNAQFSLLCVHLIQAKDILAREFSGTADPYAKVRLLPDTKVVRQSNIHRKTLNPQFEEDFVFNVAANELQTRTLEILIYDYDQFSRHTCLGGVAVAMEDIDPSEKVTLWKGISPVEEIEDRPEWGELMFSLGYLPSAERFTVVILKARNLRPVEDSKKSTTAPPDPYVKVSLMQNGGRRLKKKKTSTQRSTINPVFNEAVTFNVTKDVLKTATLEFTVVHDSVLAQKEVLGKVTLTPDSSHIVNMLASKSAVAMWHRLHPPQGVTTNAGES